jgi:hypothetical protein
MEKDTADSLNEIIASRKIVPTTRGPLWFVFPLLKDKLLAKYFYFRKMEECKKQSILTIEDSLKFHKDIGEWSDAKDNLLQKFPVFIEETLSKIKVENNRVKKKKYEDWLRKLQKDYASLVEAKNVILLNSAEYLSNSSATLYLTWSSLRNLDDSKLWPTFDDIEQCSDIAWVEELLSLFYEFSKDLDIKKIREIARSSLWRVRWNTASGDTQNLFGRSGQDLTNDQFLLVYWSQVYDSVYESLERPPDSIIENDEELDAWLKEQGEKRARDIGPRYYATNSTSGKNDKMENSNDIYRVVDGKWNKDGNFERFTDEDRWKEIERIRELNSPGARALKKKEEEKLRNNPGVFVQEHELRRRKEDREIMGGKVTKILKKG